MSARRNPPVALLAFAVSLVFARPSSADFYVEVTTPEGQFVRGLIREDIGFEIEGSLGKIQVPASKLRSLAIDGTSASLTLQDFSICNGTLSKASVKVQWAAGETEFDFARVRRVEFVAKNKNFDPAGHEDFAQDPGFHPTVSIATVDGTGLRGELSDVAAFEMDTDLGRLRFDHWKVGQITVGAEDQSLTTTSGSRIRGKLLVTKWKVHESSGDTEISLDQVKSIYFDRVAPAVPDSVLNPPTPVPASGMKWPDGFKVTGCLEEPTTVIGAPVLSADGSRIFVLESKKPRLLTIDVATFKVTQEIPLPPEIVSFSVAPGDRTAFGAVGNMVYQLDLVAGKLQRKFEVEGYVYWIVALSDDVAVGTGESLVVISASRQAIVKRGGHGGNTLVHFPSRKMLFSGGCATGYSEVVTKAEDLKLESFGLPMPSGIDISSWTASDGRFLLDSRGACYRVGRPGAAAVAPAPFFAADIMAAADFSAEGRWFVFRQREVVEVSLSTLTIVRRTPLSGNAGAALADGPRGLLFVFAGEKLDIERTPPEGRGRLARPGLWYKLQIGK